MCAIISPKIFTVDLEGSFQKMISDEIGVNIDGKYLNQLQFTNGILLISVSLGELQEILNDLNNESLSVDLKCNGNKIKLAYNCNI